MRAINKLPVILLFILLFLFFCSLRLKAQTANDTKDNQATQYHALIATILKYRDKWPDLSARETQVDEFALQLKKNDYHVTRIVNPDRTGLQKSIQQFILKHSNKKHTLLICYTGHCYQDPKGNSCLIAADTPLPSSKNGLNASKALPVNDVIEFAREHKTYRLLFAFDGSVSIHEPDFSSLHGPSPQKKDILNSSPLVILGAGSSDEALPTESNFVSLLTESLKKNKTLQANNTVLIEPFFDLLLSSASFNSWRIPWCKTNGDKSMIKNFIVMDERSNSHHNNPRTLLKIRTITKSANIRILNINPKYNTDGMKLVPGSYHIEVSAPGYKLKTEWIKLQPDEDLQYTIFLTANATPPSSQEPTDPPSSKEPASPSPSTVTSGENIKDNSAVESGSGFNLIRIEKGNFLMGGRRYNEQPIHEEIIKSAFFIMDTEVSRKQYSTYLKETGNHSFYMANASTEDLPVVNVNWHDAMDYANWLSQKTGKTYRLPTEAEWEYVAKKGLESQGNIVKYLGESTTAPRPVRKAWKNSLNIFGMPGNVWEWCLDCWNEKYIPDSTQHNNSTTCSNRVIRGGSWRDSVKRVSPTIRNGIVSTTKSDHIGFRLVSEQ